MPRAHGDCKFRDEWLVQDTLYKEWVVKDGDPRIAMRDASFDFYMKSSIIIHSMQASCNANSRMNSALGQLVHLRKSNASRDMCLCYSCVVNITFWIQYYNEFLILDKFKFQPHHHHGPGNCRQCSVTWTRAW